MLRLTLWCILLATGSCLSGNTLNLLSNGDFSQGNIGFATNYTYSATDCGPAGFITVGRDPFACNGAAPSFGDHTTGSGLMLIANGATTPGIVAWEQTVSVELDRTYTFTGWVADWGNDLIPGEASPNLLLIANGSVLLTFSPPRTDGAWTKVSAQWNSGSASVATIQIIDTTAVALGDDFALDDLSFGVTAKNAVPEPGSFSLVGLAIAAVSLLRFTRRP